ncbi:MAG TPA: hypothetical protein VK934_00270 [Fimbriimonas sp.]|nr:hypothetical protein [Fimbriimonas sp.]
MLEATESEQRRRDEVMARVRRFIAEGITIRLPDFDGASAGCADFALLALEPNDFSGSAGEFRYQFEGEDDLLHLAVMRQSGEPLVVEEARQIVHFLLPEVAPALIWLRPGTVSQHFYVGHEEVVNSEVARD